MDGYTKLHAKIISSSIWDESTTTRVLWITMLALADCDGNIEASVSGLAAFARISKKEATEGLSKLMSPEGDSTDGTDGTRITMLTSGVYHILNHKHYRERQTRKQALDARRKRKSREKEDMSGSSHDVTGPCVRTQKQLNADAGSLPSVAPIASQSSAHPKRGVVYPEDFEVFWSVYPKKAKKGDALRAWKKLSKTERDRVVEAVPTFARLVVAPKFVPYPASYLNARSFDDDPKDLACCDRSKLTPQQLCDINDHTEESGVY